MPSCESRIKRRILRHLCWITLIGMPCTRIGQCIEASLSLSSEIGQRRIALDCYPGQYRQGLRQHLREFAFWHSLDSFVIWFAAPLDRLPLLLRRLHLHHWNYRYWKRGFRHLDCCCQGDHFRQAALLLLVMRFWAHHRRCRLLIPLRRSFRNSQCWGSPYANGPHWLEGRYFQNSVNSYYQTIGYCCLQKDQALGQHVCPPALPFDSAIGPPRPLCQIKTL